jgi:acetyltransferase-like isoleucine patch superfamily enzyme
MFLRIANKILKRLAGVQVIPVNKKRLSVLDNKHLHIAANSILLEGTSLDFRQEISSSDTYVSIGAYCLIKAIFTFETTTGLITIGNNVHIGNAHFICRSAITIHDDVTMAWGITLYDHNSHSIHWEERKDDNKTCYEDFVQHHGNNIVNKNWINVVSRPIVIESKAWIGFNVTILKGVTIGEGAVIGACSVVTKDVPAWTVVAGNPATVVKQLQKPE